MIRIPTRSRAAVLAAAALALSAAAGPAAAAPAVHQRSAAAANNLTARTLFSGKSRGWSSPDDLTRSGNDLFVSFQNGVPSTGGAKGTPADSIIVKLSRSGRIEHTWRLAGKCDGLAADPAHHRIVATVNEDGNSSLYTLPAAGTGAATHYGYDAAPLPHGGGTDSITIYRGGIYVVASAPAAGGPALYRVVLGHGVAHLATAPFYDSSNATTANTAARRRTVHLALTDPDSSTVVPAQSPRFAGSFMLDAQGDQQEIFADNLGHDNQHLQELSLSQSVDDTAFATTRRGELVATYARADTVVVISGAFGPGTAYAAVTPSNANHPGTHPAPNYLGAINLNTGVVSTVHTRGVALTPHSLIYVG
ncbi:MAG TPA: hypothetical protein VGN48_11475 [Pedococcus sp.]|nr:hypothetical protein [Pedococcus sp.]